MLQGQELLADEVAACKELISLESDASKCKWPLLTLARLYRLQSSQQGSEQLDRQIADLFRQLMSSGSQRRQGTTRMSWMAEQASC